MVGPLFTAFAMIASGRVELPPVPMHLPMSHARALVPEESARADKNRRRR